MIKNPELAGLLAFNAVVWSAPITCWIEGKSAPLWAILTVFGLAGYIASATQTWVVRQQNDDQTV